MTGSLNDRVRQVIAASSLNNAEFAAAIGLDGPKLAKSLADKRRFSSLELAEIAELTGESIDWLLTGNVQARVFSHRSTADAVAQGDEMGRDTIGLVADRIQGLTSLGRAIEVPALPVPFTTGMDVDQGRVTAERYVQALGAPVRSLSTQALIKSVERQFGLHVVVTELPKGCDGLSYSSGDVRVIVLTNVVPAYRQRFTLAHEIAHIAFADASGNIIEEDVYAQTTDRSERRANAFAAHFLAPLSEIRGMVGDEPSEAMFDDIVLDFQMSPRAVAWHLFNAGLMSEASRMQHSELSARAVALRSGRGAEHAERDSEAKELRPAWRLVQAYLDAYAEGDATLKPAATLLGWSTQRTEGLFADSVSFDLNNE